MTLTNPGGHPFKGEDAQATERLVEAILRCLNLAPDLAADVKIPSLGR